ncbi:MerR family transcriptional regulator [Roseivirga misakiensis]|uniref:MerR family transcriptional regulator n=1 Tax=Roseivirga misakiensis TaxID=1563681 RepID=A0A1E5T0E4_9BACT|nr:MerR family transcriptional regulator [Roseivirga misakiensis]OEK04844.1 MerR family transcriptional regulator [Roseivirga misakiensis]
MPYKEKPIVKKYFTIGEVAKLLGVATSLIRFWETQFDFIRPKKNAKGNRKFTQDDLKKLKLVYHLVKEKGYTLQGAQEHIKNSKDSVDDKAEIIESLRNVRSFLEEMKKNLP